MTGPAAEAPDYQLPHVHTERVRHSGALVVSALVDDGAGSPWLHHVTYYGWDPDDGDPREAFVADVLARGWTFDDDD